VSVKQLDSPRRRAMRSTSWEPEGELSFTEWRDLGRQLGLVARASQWWIGDWINFGAGAYGEKYLEAVAVTGYDVGSLMDMAYVASRFEISRRRENLSWSHHQELASLPPADQDELLDLAEREHWSRKRLRGELRKAREQEPLPASSVPSPGALATANDGTAQATRQVRLVLEADVERQVFAERIALLCEQAEELGLQVVARNF